MIAVYVSGHGFGHATRTRAVLDALRRIRPGTRVCVRTPAPRALFPGYEYEPVTIEGRIVESEDALSIDGAATAAGVREFLLRADGVIAEEAAFLRASEAELVVADIPFAAGDIARAAGVPSIAMGNFTWDWILEPLLDDAALLTRMREGYGAFDMVLRMPLTQPRGWDVFRSVAGVPLVTPRSTRDRLEIRRQLGLSDEATAILIGGRGALGAKAIERAACDSPGLCFLTQEIVTGPNIFPFLPGPGLLFSDVLRASDVVVSKLGYSIAAECIAEGKRLLFPPRDGFREEQVLAAEVPAYVPAVAIPPADHLEGRWKPFLDVLLGMPFPGATLQADGAESCARILASYCHS